MTQEEKIILALRKRLDLSESEISNSEIKNIYGGSMDMAVVELQVAFRDFFEEFKRIFQGSMLDKISKKMASK